MADETENTGPNATEVGGVQQVQMQGDQQGQAKIEGDKANQSTPAPERPEGLPEGFDNWEAFGKAQLEAQQKAGEEGAKTELTPEQTAQVEASLKDLPADRQEAARPFIEEAARTGTLSEESVTEAAKAFGVTEDMVRQYLEGAQARAGTQTVTPIMEAIGGAEVFEEFAAWAEAGGMTADQQKAFNEGLKTDPTKTVTEAVQAWKESGNGPAARDITRGERPQTSVNATKAEPYASQAEMQRDMASPQYSKDPAFRAKVEARVGASDFGNATVR